MFSLILHGGAGNWDGDSIEKLSALDLAAKEALNAYRIHKTVQSAAIAAVVYMENDPIFNAGYGSALNIDGDVECDAALVIGCAGKTTTGAVCALKEVKNPILAAQRVMTETSHVLLAGNGALRFAKSTGLECADLRTPARIREWQGLLANIKRGISHGYFTKYPSSLIPADKKFGTVGCVATDGCTLVSATSTGGVPLKLAGRVGDSAIIGAGTFAGNRCAVSCTGKGELALKTLLSQRVETFCETQFLAQAVSSALSYLTDIYGSENMALIAVDLQGNIAYNTNKKAFGVAIIENDTVRVEKIGR